MRECDGIRSITCGGPIVLVLNATCAAHGDGVRTYPFVFCMAHIIATGCSGCEDDGTPRPHPLRWATEALPLTEGEHAV